MNRRAFLRCLPALVPAFVAMAAVLPQRAFADDDCCADHALLQLGTRVSFDNERILMNVLARQNTKWADQWEYYQAGARGIEAGAVDPWAEDTWAQVREWRKAEKENEPA